MAGNLRNYERTSSTIRQLITVVAWGGSFRWISWMKIKFDDVNYFALLQFIGYRPETYITWYRNNVLSKMSFNNFQKQLARLKRWIFVYRVLRRKADSKVRYLNDVVQQLECILDIKKKWWCRFISGSKTDNYRFRQPIDIDLARNLWVYLKETGRFISLHK